MHIDDLEATALDDLEALGEEFDSVNTRLELHTCPRKHGRDGQSSVIVHGKIMQRLLQ